MNRTLPGASRDVALLLARLLLGTIMFAHGYQKLMVDGLGRTTQGFESMSIPVAIFSAAFVTVVEVVGSILVILGALLPVVAACYLVVMVGAAAFVHVQNGIFVGAGGWELVGAIAGLLLVLAAAGPGRYGLDHLWRARHAAADPPSADPSPPPAPEPTPEAVAQHDVVARAAAFTQVLPRVSADAATPPVAAPVIPVPRAATPAPLPVRRRRPRPTPAHPPER